MVGIAELGTHLLVVKGPPRFWPARAAFGAAKPGPSIANTSLKRAGINFAIRNYFSMLPSMPQGKEMKAKLDAALSLEAEDFEDRWAAD